MSSVTFQEICTALRQLRGYDFEVLCNQYLKARYPNLTPLGLSIRAPWPIRGTPDAFGLDESGDLIACQYSTQQSRWRSKLCEDAQKVAVYARANQLTVRQFIFCTTVEDDPAAFSAAQRETSKEHGFPVEICGLRRLAHDLETLYPGIALRRLGIRIRLQNFMTLDAYVDDPRERYWPKHRDIDEGKIYRPKSYILRIRELLSQERRCLVTGISGAGKTVVAIAFGLQWREEHPEAVVFYLEAPVACAEDTGENWYQQILAHDYQNELFLIDNCHLAPAAVNAFSRQWERKRPERAFVLLISRPRATESSWEGEAEDYFDSLEQAEGILPVVPEEIYAGVLHAYSEAYCRRPDGARFVAIEVDLANPECVAKLERDCAHNLAATRSWLEAWGRAGGRLSDVTEEAVLNGLASRYLTVDKSTALARLCALAQFEISAHDSFVNQLPPKQVARLQRENLLMAEDSPYGRCHLIDFHPQVAAQIFRAHIRRQVGAGYESRVNDETFSLLKIYLSTCPENFKEVYYRLYRAGAIELQHRLLRDAESQACAARQFTTRPLDEVVWYLYAMHRIDKDRAQNLLQDFVSRMTAEAFRTRVLALTGTQFYIVSSFLPKMSLDVARRVLGDLPAHWVANRIASAHVRSIWEWISLSSSSLAADLGYPRAWRQQVARALDVDALVTTAQKVNPQSVMWFLGALIGIAKEQAKLFVDRLSPETLGQRMSDQPVNVIHRVFEWLKALGFDPAFRKRMANALDRTALLTRAQEASLQGLYWILRDLNSLAPEVAERILTHVTPAGLAKMFREEPASLHDIRHFEYVSDRRFMRSFLQELDDRVIVGMFKRSRLAHIGSLLEWRFHRFEKPYSIFATESLRDKLATGGIDEVGKFITRLQRVPQEGQRLALQALELLLETDLAVRVAESDVQPLALLLLSAHSVDRSYPHRLLTVLAPSRAVEKCLEHSGIRGIQLLLHNLSEMAPTFLPGIGQYLRTVDLTDRIAEAEIKDLGYFLWNVRAHVGAELAQSYCRIVDAELDSEQIANVDLIQLGDFLWNLVHISDMEDLQTLGESALQGRLRKEWGTHAGPCARILGILVTVRPNAIKDVKLPIFDVDRMSGMLTEWLTELLKERHPYAYALTVKGLQALDERWAVEIVRNGLQPESAVDECLELLREAMRQAVTPRSRAVLEEAIRLIQQIGNV